MIQSFYFRKKSNFLALRCQMTYFTLSASPFLKNQIRKINLNAQSLIKVSLYVSEFFTKVEQKIKKYVIAVKIMKL